ncbi:hypothetical protein, partial [Microvirga flocculans]|uniref:hypothetical protein n=1 Tax=Microvirga flocculans TaxID=217168 RepID=UPI001AEECA6C
VRRDREPCQAHGSRLPRHLIASARKSRQAAPATRGRFFLNNTQPTGSNVSTVTDEASQLFRAIASKAKDIYAILYEDEGLRSSVAG